MFAFLDLTGRPTLRVASGGHPNPLVRTGGSVSPVEAAGTILGPFREWDGVEAVISLSAGELVLFYSDGVVEARRRSEEFGVDRLVRLLAGPALGDATTTIETSVAALNEFGSTASDDVALLALRVSPADELR